jgi:hypothetical protein
VPETVFLSGSRKISRLNDRIRARIDNVVTKRLHVLVGDANGADKAMQTYLADKRYSTVTVYCANGLCRNNVGQWDVKAVTVPPELTGRDFYTQKDIAMAEDADYGLVLWDGKSVGSINNILELAKRGKMMVVYLSIEQQFITLRVPADVSALVDKCDPVDRAEIQKKSSLSRKLRDITNAQQQTMDLI